MAGNRLGTESSQSGRWRALWSTPLILAGGGQGSQGISPWMGGGTRSETGGSGGQLKILLIRLDASFHPSLKPSAPCLPGSSRFKMIERGAKEN